MSLNSVRLELRPRQIEAEISRYMDGWLRRKLKSKVFELDDAAREAIEHIASRGFLAGKVTAARETQTPWQIVNVDSLIIESLSNKFAEDFEKIMHDTRIDIIMDGTSNWKRVQHRLNALAQVLAWSAYRKGKASEYRRSIPIFQAQRYKYENYFFLVTRMDQDVCEKCLRAAEIARLYFEAHFDYDEFANLIGWQDYGYHPFCRCELVATPTVALIHRHDRFLERAFMEDVGDEPHISPLDYEHIPRPRQVFPELHKKYEKVLKPEPETVAEIRMYLDDQNRLQVESFYYDVQGRVVIVPDVSQQREETPSPEIGYHAPRMIGDPYWRSSDKIAARGGIFDRTDQIGDYGFETVDDPKEVYLSWFGLREGYRGQGNGTLASQHMEDYFRKQGYETVYIVPQKEAEGFWIKMGYEKTDMTMDQFRGWADDQDINLPWMWKKRIVK